MQCQLSALSPTSQGLRRLNQQAGKRGSFTTDPAGHVVTAAPSLTLFDVALFGDLILARKARPLITAGSLVSHQPSRKEPRHDHGRRFGSRSQANAGGIRTVG